MLQHRAIPSTLVRRAAATTSSFCSVSVSERDLKQKIPEEKKVETRMPTIRYRLSKGQQIMPAIHHYENADDKPSIDELNQVPALSDVADKFVGRTAYIHKPGRHHMTSGRRTTNHWRIQFDHTDKWKMPLMGWLSSADMLPILEEKLRFDTLEQAIAFAERNGIKYEVQEPQQELSWDIDNIYDYNFLTKPERKLIAEEGPRRARKQWSNEDLGKSHWLNLKRSNYGKSKWEANAYIEE